MMMKTLLILLMPYQCHFHFKISKNWQTKVIQEHDLSAFDESLTKLPKLNLKTKVYLILENSLTQKMIIEKPQLKLDHQAISQLINYHLSQQELSTQFYFDYKLHQNTIEVTYVESDKINQIKNQLNQTTIKFIGQIEPNYFNTEIQPDLLLKKIQFYSTETSNFFPCREIQLKSLKKNLILKLCFIGLISFFITYIFFISLEREQNQLIYQQSVLTQKKQQALVLIHQLEPEVNFFTQEQNKVKSIEASLTHIEKSIQSGIWLSLILKENEKWQLEGKALASFLIKEFVQYYKSHFLRFELTQQMLTETTFNLNLQELN